MNLIGLWESYAFASREVEMIDTLQGIDDQEGGEDLPIGATPLPFSQEEGEVLFVPGSAAPPFSPDKSSIAQSSTLRRVIHRSERLSIVRKSPVCHPKRVSHTLNSLL